MPVRRSAFAALAVLLLGLAGCDDDPRTVTGVQLTIRYAEPAPVWLYVVGKTQDGRVRGAALLPDPPRALAPRRETVLLELPATMHGALLKLSVSGLDARRAPRMEGTVETEVVRNTIQSALVLLSSEATKPGSMSTDAGMAHVPAAGGATSSADASVALRDAAVVRVPGASSDAAVVTEPDEGEDETDEDEDDAEPDDPEPTPAEPAMDASAVCESLLCALPLMCAEGADGCELQCLAGTYCAMDCGDAHDCKPRCMSATCNIECATAERCRPQCEGSSDCEIHCVDAKSCEDARCKGSSQCLIYCESGDCKLDCPPDKKKNCGDGVIACNRECPLLLTITL